MSSASDALWTAIWYACCMSMSDERLTTGEAARELGLSPARIRQLDDELQPELIGERGWRADRRHLSAAAVERRPAAPAEREAARAGVAR